MSVSTPGDGCGCVGVGPAGLCLCDPAVVPVAMGVAAGVLCLLLARLLVFVTALGITYSREPRYDMFRGVCILLQHAPKPRQRVPALGCVCLIVCFSWFQV